MAPFVAPLEYSGMIMECSEEIAGFAGLKSHVAPHKSWSQGLWSHLFRKTIFFVSYIFDLLEVV